LQNANNGSLDRGLW